MIICIPYVRADIASAWLQGKAAACGQQNKWTEAQIHMNQLIVDNPDQPDLIYDSGVAAYRLGEYARAEAYFDEVTKLAQVPHDLKKQTHFNLGNTKVALNQLPQAVTQYEQVLAIEPDNKPAQHNLAKVKEMMKQQQKQNQQQNAKNQKQQQDKNEQNTQNNAQQNESEQNDSKESQQGSQNQQHPNQKQESSGNQEKKQKSSDQQERQQNGESNDQSSDQNRDQKQNELRNSHASSSKESKQGSNAQPTQRGAKAQGTQKGVIEDTQNDTHAERAEQQFGANEQWMARMLAYQEKADKEAQKVLIKANVNKQLAGHNGQNCW